jgi:hypothetical protein
MDRNFRVLNNGRLVAELKFKYERQPYGNVDITTYGWYYIDEEETMISVYPRWTHNTTVHHNHLLNSIEEIKAFDWAFVQKDANISAEDLKGNLEFIYERMHYRYHLSTHIAPIGIIDIKADFYENIKELQFTSARQIREDYPLSSNSVECNKELMRRLAELEFLNLPYADYKEVEGWYW